MKIKAAVLVHLGTPADFSEAAAAEFLAEFLGDPDVVRAPSFVRKFLAGRVAKKRAAAYLQSLKDLAVGGKMQLDYYGGRIASKLEARLGLPVRHAGMYGKNTIEKAVSELSELAGRDILFIPLYPQYSTATSLPAEKKILQLGFSEEQIVKSYFDKKEYVDALATAAREARKGADMLLGSFHALPIKTPGVNEYVDECGKTMSLLSARLGGKPWELAWQSAMGFGRWTSPKAEDRARALARSGAGRIAVICPGFFCDCLETSLEVDRDLRKTFLESGGKNFVYINCLNDGEAQIALLEKIFNERNTG